MKSLRKRNRLWGLGILVLVLVGCATVTDSSIRANAAPTVNLNDNWILLPSINNTEVPQAGGRLDSIAANLLRVHGVSLNVYSPTMAGSDPSGNNNADTGIFDLADRHSQDLAMAQAKKLGARYAVAGSVDEWRYKVGLEGQPAAGVSFTIVDLATGQVIWSGSAAETGSSSEAVSALAQDLVDKLLSLALSNGKIARSKK